MSEENDLSDEALIKCQAEAVEQIPPHMYDATEVDIRRAMFAEGWYQCRRRAQTKKCSDTNQFKA